MNLDGLIITAFCQFDDTLKQFLCNTPKQRLRTLGPQPKLEDSEVLCIEVIAAYLGFSQDKALFDYFRRHYQHFFPALKHIHRTTFTRQATNLWKLKEHLWQHLLRAKLLRAKLPQGRLNFLNSVPLAVCHGARSTFCRRFRYPDIPQLQATYGHDHAAN